MQIRFDRGPDGGLAQFADPIEIIEAHNIADVAGAFVRLEDASSNGHWVSGFATYELGFALEDVLHSLMPTKSELPLLRFGVFEGYSAPDAIDATASIEEVQPQVSFADYETSFQRVHEYIEAGDIYQANLTFPIEAITSAPSRALYAALEAQQPVQYGALIEQQGLPDILCRSPELFFRTDGEGKIEVQPMKGTQPRSDDLDEDAANKVFLARDEKNRAENLMIVDLMRNDLSRICKIGSVKVPKLFEVESFATVHQMTSLVTGSLSKKSSLGEIFSALFPCGSITGAPKIRAMEILAELERRNRETYCGTIGWWAPDGRSEFNVAIRTILKDGQRLRFNVGGGVVYDSTAEAEYEEALWKARYAAKLLKT